jgi:hypothetical protein
MNFQYSQSLAGEIELGTGLAISTVQDLPTFIGDMIMKLEAFLLRGLFVACLLVCGLVLGAMVNASPDAIRLAAAGSAGQLIAPTVACALPPDGVVCPRSNG